LRGAAPLVLAAALASCNAYRNRGALDAAERAEAEDLRATLAGREVALADDDAGLADALRAFGLRVEAGAATRIEVGPIARPVELARGERDTLFFLLTLGLWPQTRVRQDGADVRIGDGGRFEVEADETLLCGWIAGPLALLPGWSYGGAGCRRGEESAARRDERAARVAFEIARRLARPR
jgi:hypothetical protein